MFFLTLLSALFLTIGLENAKNDGTPEWRNWQTRWTQNPVCGNTGVGSIPSSGSSISLCKLRK